MAKLPASRKPVGSKWVFKVKYYDDGTIEKFKARVVAQRYSQVYGIDFEETYAPTVRYDTLRLLFAIATIEDWEIHQMDAISAYLAGELKENIYMYLPEGCDALEGEFCHLLKSIYGLKQAARVWNRLLTSFLEGLGFVKFHADHSVMSNGHVIIAIYVDDILLFGKSLKEVKIVKALIARKFQVKNLGEASVCLGIYISRDRKN